MKFTLLRVWKTNKSPAEQALIQMGFNTKRPMTQKSRIRLWPFRVIVVMSLTLLWGKLFLLTVVEGSYRRELADINRVTAIRTSASRGLLYDQSGIPLVTNQANYKRQVPGSSIPQGLFELITHDQAVALTRVSGERVFFDVKRLYPCGRACAPLVGYMSEVEPKDLGMSSDYVLGDLIGKTGLESLFETRLRGIPGQELVEVDAAGKLVRVVGSIPEKPGNDIHLTIDRGLQEVLFQALADRPGAAIASVPQTGEILALVSSPAYDPENIAISLTEEGQPFFNRVLAGAYPPGSVYKIVLAVAGLEEGVITTDSTYEDTGEIKIDEYRFGNWLFDKYGRTDGLVNIEKALQRSNDIYFYRLGEALGPVKIGEWSRLLGFEATTELNKLGEVAGLIPSPEWKEKTLGEKWFLGNTYHMAIGQGDVKVTPFQINRMMGVIAASGVLCNPVLTKTEVGKQSCRQLNLKESTLTAIQAGLQKACEPGGTGAPFFQFNPKVACKTGTAQQGGDEDHPHAWFTSYAPASAPEIAITVLVEKGGEGSEVAAPIAKAGYEYWFNRERGSDSKNY